MIAPLIKKFAWLLFVFLIMAGIAGGIGWYLFFTAPVIDLLKIDEPRFGSRGAAIVYVTSETTLVELADELMMKGIIRSPKVFLSIMEKLNLSKKIKRGIYAFDAPQNVFSIADKLSSGDFGYEQVKVTIPEGYTTFAIAEILPSKLVDIKKEDFMVASQGLEGYLFPDTYFFYPYATSSAVIGLMRSNFDKKISVIEKELNIDFVSTANIKAIEAQNTAIDKGSDISATLPKTLSLARTIILASILEKEVQTFQDMSIVADLFNRREEIGMPLQADSTLTYITGKTSAELTMRDLRGDDPYNTYKNRGFPPTPISNPGLQAIRAVLNPTPNKYIYFLSDEDGVTHFSETYEEHLRLKKKYLP